MSAFLGAPGLAIIEKGILGVGSYGVNDDAVQPVDYRVTPPQKYGAGNDLRDSDILWPRASFPGTSFDNGFGGLDSVHQQWEWNFPPTGVHVPKVVSGTVKDSSGTAVSGATVMLFNTATGLLVDTQTSGSDGSYRATDPNAVNCFAVADLAGSPETAGTTNQNLTGT